MRNESVTDRYTYQYVRRQAAEAETRNSSKTGTCKTSAKRVDRIKIESLRRKVKHVASHQYH